MRRSPAARTKTSQELVSFDEHTSSAVYKWTFSTEIVPICKVRRLFERQHSGDVAGAALTRALARRLAPALSAGRPGVLQRQAAELARPREVRARGVRIEALRRRTNAARGVQRVRACASQPDRRVRPRRHDAALCRSADPAGYAESPCRLRSEGLRAECLGLARPRCVARPYRQWSRSAPRCTGAAPSRRCAPPRTRSSSPCWTSSRWARRVARHAAPSLAPCGCRSQPGANVAVPLLGAAAGACSTCWPTCRWRGRATLAGTTRPSSPALTSAASSNPATPSSGTANEIGEWYLSGMRAHVAPAAFAPCGRRSYVVANTNFNNSDFEKLNQKEVPDVVRACRAALALRLIQGRSSARSAHVACSTRPGAGAQVVPELAPQGQAACVEAAAHGHRRVGGQRRRPEARDRALRVRVRAAAVQPGRYPAMPNRICVPPCLARAAEQRGLRDVLARDRGGQGAPRQHQPLQG